MTCRRMAITMAIVVLVLVLLLMLGMGFVLLRLGLPGPALEGKPWPGSQVAVRCGGGLCLGGACFTALGLTVLLGLFLTWVVSRGSRRGHS